MAFMAQPWKDPRSGIYYIRRRVPKDVKPHLPQLGEFYKRSLETACPHSAKARHASEWLKSQELFDRTRATMRGESTLLPADAPTLAARWVESELASWAREPDRIQMFLANLGGVIVHPLDVLDDDSASLNSIAVNAIQDYLAEAGHPVPPNSSPTYSALRREFSIAWGTLCKTALQRHKGDWSTTPPTPTASRPLTQESASQGRMSPSLSEVFTLWSQNVRDTEGEGRDVLKRIAEYRATAQRFVELLGDLPVARIERITIQEFQSLLQRMPSKGAGIRALTAREQIAKADAEDLPRISKVRVKNLLMALSAILSYAARMELIPENPVTASGLTKQLSKAVSKSRRMAPRKHYTEQELLHIFSSPVYSKGWRSPRASYGEAWFWYPLLLCYTGARREEIAQLQASEVRQSSAGIWHLSLLATPDEEDLDLGRTVKTLGSHRLVALHPDLIALGFLDYVSSLPTKGQLFPGLIPNTGGWYGYNFGRRWSAYLVDIAGLVSPVRPMHGFRHSFITMCRDAGVPEELRDAITGHDNGATSRRYGDQELLRLTWEQIQKIPSIARTAGLLPT